MRQREKMAIWLDLAKAHIFKFVGVMFNELVIKESLNVKKKKLGHLLLRALRTNEDRRDELNKTDPKDSYSLDAPK